MEETKELTYGEKLVGLTFNIGNNPKVAEIKELYAKIIDIINENGPDKSLVINSFITENAISNAVSAQMWAVKAITWKD